MIINKITTGFVVQVFDTDRNKFIKQYFIAGDQVDMEDWYGNKVEDIKLPDLQFNMVQRNPDKSRKLAVSILEQFEDLLDKHKIKIPDRDRGSKNDACIYGKTYYDLEDRITEILNVVEGG
jgi:hypothetical protein